MTQLLVPAASAALGFYVGGPLGAAIGWSVGSYAVAEDPEVNVNDLRVQTASYGVGIPLLTGKQRLTGNIIYANDKTTYEIEGGKGGPATAGTGYKITLAIAICQGPILGISRVWEQGEIKSDAASSGKLPGKLYLGSDIQTPDPTMEAILGVGNVPAYRGIAYMVLEDFDLGASGAIPQFSFEVVKQDPI